MDTKLLTNILLFNDFNPLFSIKIFIYIQYISLTL